MATFLIADDSQEKILMLRHYLKVAGFSGDLRIAMTCQEAYDLIEQHTFNFAFVDYYIPSDNGPSIIRTLKTSHPQCRVALVSSAENAENSAEARLAGAEAVLCTSHRSDEVEREILELLQDWLHADRT